MLEQRGRQGADQAFCAAEEIKLSDENLRSVFECSPTRCCQRSTTTDLRPHGPADLCCAGLELARFAAALARLSVHCVAWRGTLAPVGDGLVEWQSRRMCSWRGAGPWSYVSAKTHPRHEPFGPPSSLAR